MEEDETSYRAVADKNSKIKDILTTVPLFDSLETPLPPPAGTVVAPPKVTGTRVVPHCPTTAHNLRLFYIQDLLTAAECSNLISTVRSAATTSCDSPSRGTSGTFPRLNKWYNDQFRRHGRLLVRDEQFASALFQRVVAHFESSDVCGVVPPGRARDGSPVWLPVGLNPVFRVAEYTAEEKGCFKKHMDVGWNEPDGTCSIFSLLIYLNDDFKGGNTVWFPSTDDEYGAQPEIVLQPKRGQAAIFNHDVEHEGTELTAGTKYLLRTDIMFREMKSGPNFIVGTALTDKQQEINQLFQEAMRQRVAHAEALNSGMYSVDCLRSKEAVEQFTSIFMEAAKLQHELEPSIPLDSLATNHIPIPVHDLQLLVFSFLPIKWLLKLRRVSRAVERTATDGQLWKPLYQSQFWEKNHRRDKDAIGFSVYWFGEFLTGAKFARFSEDRGGSPQVGGFMWQHGKVFKVVDKYDIHGCHGYVGTFWYNVEVFTPAAREKQMELAAKGDGYTGVWKSGEAQNGVQVTHKVLAVDGEGFASTTNFRGTEARDDVQMPERFLAAATKALQSGIGVEVDMVTLKTPRTGVPPEEFTLITACRVGGELVAAVEPFCKPKTSY
eukprot:TRINITY_DN65605_c0_g2_i1.p1 TRINITY_DN65605_c0_g2~~TRINITY_DN65605_c0_g2_i1.p1  ORF type:complete len:607 (+),score=56.63 TRINITY_DN65605_c0_g2_i1:68-1888(+)